MFMSFLGYTTSVISGAGETGPFVVAGVLPVSMVARAFCFHCTLVFVLLLVVFSCVRIVALFENLLVLELSLFVSLSMHWKD